MIWFSGPPAASNRRRRRQSLLDLFENHIYAAPKEGEWALCRSRKHSPTGRRDMGVGCQGLRQTRAAVGGGIAHQIHNKVLRGGAAAERPSWLRSQPPHQAAEEPPFFFFGVPRHRGREHHRLPTREGVTTTSATPPRQSA